MSPEAKLLWLGGVVGGRGGEGQMNCKQMQFIKLLPFWGVSMYSLSEKTMCAVWFSVKLEFKCRGTDLGVTWCIFMRGSFLWSGRHDSVSVRKSVFMSHYYFPVVTFFIVFFFLFCRFDSPLVKVSKYRVLWSYPAVFIQTFSFVRKVR